MDQRQLIEYFITETNKRLDNIDRKLDELITFRLMLLGASAAVSAIVALIFTYMGK